MKIYSNFSFLSSILFGTVKIDLALKITMCNKKNEDNSMLKNGIYHRPEGAFTCSPFRIVKLLAHTFLMFLAILCDINISQI